MPKKRSNQNLLSEKGSSVARHSNNYSNDDRRSLIDTLVDQSQVENMGYGEDACPKCGASGYGNACIHCGRKHE